MTVTNLILNNGVVIPSLGFGVYQTSGQETVQAVSDALEVGYRHVDTAAGYGNEREVGTAVAASRVPRDEIIIETKLFVPDYGRQKALHGFEKAAGKLQVERIDLLLLHSPLPSAFDRTIGAYQALEQLLAEGRVRAIGVSNFSLEDLAALLEATDVVPAVNQVELHPYFQQPELTAFHAEHGILTQAWSPLGGITFYGDGRKGASTMEDPVLTDIGRQHGVSAAQVMLRWHVQLGHSAIPKSTKRARMEQNLDVFGFELSAEEMGRIATLDTGVRGGPDPADVTLESVGDLVIPEA